MSKLFCPCGSILSNVGFPCRYKGELHSELNQDELNFGQGRSVWQCSTCYRIAIDTNTTFGSKVEWWIPETTKGFDIFDEMDR